MTRLHSIGVGLALVTVLVAGFAYGVALEHTKVFPYYALETAFRSVKDRISPPSLRPEGRWRRHQAAPGREDLTEEQLAEIERLEAIAYLSGSREAPERSGVAVHDPERAWDGLNLVVSGHAAWAGLVDMDGRVLHEWRYEFRRVWPDNPISDEAVGTHYWRYVHLCEDGSILAIFEGTGLIKLDRDSNLLWDRPGGYHHDLKIADDDSIYILQHKAHIVPRWSTEHPMLEHFVTVLDSEGHPGRSVSLLAAFEDSPYSATLKWAPTLGDPFHSNSVQVLTGSLSDRLPAFRAGNALISIRELDTIAVVDLDAGSIVWTISGLSHRQHDATLLPNSHILLFNNLRAPGVSEVLEFDPFTQRVCWTYTGSDEHPFYSETCGECQRLPNGNTLIVESDNGRAFEVTVDGTIVWEYVNPHRAGKNGELIATLFEVVRLPGDFPTDWIDGADR